MSNGPDVSRNIHVTGFLSERYLDRRITTYYTQHPASRSRNRRSSAPPSGVLRGALPENGNSSIGLIRYARRQQVLVHRQSGSRRPAWGSVSWGAQARDSLRHFIFT